MVEIKETSYKDERLGFFADQRKLVQKRYDRLEKQIKPDEPYTSERREFLSDCGRELSFYNDVIEMLENDVVPKSEVAKEIFEEIDTIFREHFKRNQSYSIWEPDIMQGLKQSARYTINELWHDLAELKKKYLSE